jgi:hypothetical protein
MAATVTKVKGPSNAIGGLGVKYIISVLLDTSFASGGEAIDLTSYFKYIYGGCVLGVDANADAAYKFGLLLPGPTVAVTASNVKVTAYQSNTGAVALDEANTVDLSGVGALTFEITGAPAIQTSWA